MSNKVWVCFNCRTTTRRVQSSVEVRCPSCSKQCEYLGHKIRVPPKNQLKKWQELRDSLHQSEKESILYREMLNVRWIHDLEREIERLEAMPENEGRKSAIKQLKKRLKMYGVIS